MLKKYRFLASNVDKCSSTRLIVISWSSAEASISLTKSSEPVRSPRMTVVGNALSAPLARRAETLSSR